MLHNFSFASLEIWKFRYENLYAVGLIYNILISTFRHKSGGMFVFCLYLIL